MSDGKLARLTSEQAARALKWTGLERVQFQTPLTYAMAYRCQCGADWLAPKDSPVEKPPKPWRAVWKGFGGWRWRCGECPKGEP